MPSAREIRTASLSLGVARSLRISVWKQDEVIEATREDTRWSEVAGPPMLINTCSRTSQSVTEIDGTSAEQRS